MRLVLAAMLMAATSVFGGAGNDAVTVLQKGLFEEEANHDLKAAIQAYQSVITQFDKDRKLAATAVFRLGECYRKQGNTNDANAQYQRVISEFPDQEQVVRLSRQNLAALGASAGAVPVQGPAPSVAAAGARAPGLEGNAAAEAERLKVQLSELKRLPPDKRRIAVQQEFPNAVLASLMQRLGQAEQDLAAKRIDFGPDHLEVRKGMALVELLDKQVDEQVNGVLQALEIRQTAAAAAASAVARTEPKTTARPSAETEELKRIRAMIADSPDLINAKEPDGRTPLHKATAASQLAVAQFLLENGADIKARDNTGETALYLAVIAGNKGLVELLLSNGADVNAADNEGKTPLYAAAEKGFRTILEVLLEHRADVRAQTRAEATPLHAAVNNGFKSIAQVLLARGADVNSVGNGGQVPPLWIAASRGDEPVVELLLTNGANVNPTSEGSSGMSPLDVAAQRGAVGVMRLLLARGAEVNAKNQDEMQRGWTALHYAVDAQRQDAVKLLLENKADPNARLEVNYNPWGSAPQARSRGESDPGYTPLLIAAGNKPSAEITQLLLAAKADPNLKSERGVTPLVRAMMLAPPLRKEIAALLLDHGADPNDRGGDEKTPLMWAAMYKDKDVAALLVDHKADVSLTDPFGSTALNIVISSLSSSAPIMGSNQDAFEIARMLLAAGADPNTQDKQGQTPLNRLTNQPDFGVKEKLTALLREHGATEDLPRMDRIEVRRPSANYTQTVFIRGTNDYNRFTLFELLAVHYRFVSTASSSGSMPQRAYAPLPPSSFSPRIYGVGGRMEGPLKFPALENVVIRRPTADGKSWREMRVDVAKLLQSPDCSSDVPLQWGDVVEIPEADHPINAAWQGLPEAQFVKLQKCLQREVQITVKEQKTKIPLAPERGGEPRFMLVPVLNQSGLLRASSDLSRVKVRRHDARTRQSYELVLDCSDAAPDLWLRDGDEIGVPEKP